MNVWKPHATVGCVIEREGRFLFVEERTSEGMRINQPAGHLEKGESLLQAALRETLEETAWQVQLDGLVGVYRWRMAQRDRTYLRFCFHGRPLSEEAERPLDHGIIRSVWLSREELSAPPCPLRSPLVLACLDDYLAGRRYPLDLLQDIS